MPISRSSEQSSKTLKEFYQEVAKWAKAPGVGQGMLELLAMINGMFKETQLYGLTSHYRLCIQAEDDWTAPWYVVVVGSRFEKLCHYTIEYLLPENPPWPHASVRGEARSLADAKNYLLIAMHRSQGWKNNPELEELLKENGLYPENANKNP